MATSPVSLQQQYDQYGNPLPPGATQGTPAAGNPYSSGVNANAGPYGNPYATATPGLNTGNDVNNSNFYNVMGINYANENQVQNEAKSQLGYYGPLQVQAQQQEQAALQQLNQTPGYTPGEANQINVNYGQFNTPTAALQAGYLNPSEQAGIAGNPNAVENVMKSGVAGEGAMLNQYQANAGGQLDKYGTNLDTAASNYGTGVTGAVGSLGTGLSSAQGKFTGLDAAVANPGLAFNPGGKEKEITDAQVQQMTTNAGERIGAQYRTAEDTLQRQAAAAGNTSPEAEAAARARLMTQESSDQGTEESQAYIAALQAQQQQATSIEQQREQATQYQTGLQANASTTEEQAAQAAAALAGTQGIQGAEAVGQTNVNAANALGQAGLNLANQYGQFSTNTQADIANKQYGAAAAADTTSSARAAELAGNRQAVLNNVNNTQYAQGTGSAQLTSGGAQTTGNARIVGQGAYRQGVAQQQGLAQQGGQTAAQLQQTAAGTEGSLLNSGIGEAGNFKNQSPTFAGQAAGLIGAIGTLGIKSGGGSGGSDGGGAKGGVFTEPTELTIGEDGPEAVVPLTPRYRPNRKVSLKEAA
jgi:hypothetical protein